MSDTKSETPPTTRSRARKVRAKARDTVPRGPKRGAGASLVPSFQSTPGVATRQWFWCGSFPTSPRGSLTIAGCSFPQVTYKVKKRVGTAPSVWVPRIGCLLELTPEQVAAIITQLPYLVIRFTEPSPQVRKDFEEQEVGSVGEGIDAMDSVIEWHQDGKQLRRKGHPIRIPTADELKERKKNELPANAYVKGQWDEPMASYIFAVRCDNQKSPKHGTEYPEPLSTTGLIWPGQE